MKVQGADGAVQVYEESGRTVIATSFLLETGQARQIQIIYRPNLASAGSPYALLVQKQPGAGAVPLRVRVDLADIAGPTAASPPGGAWIDGVAVWQSWLSSDQEFSVAWE